MTTGTDTKASVPRDPGRRDRLIDVALEVVAARGVAGATHRAVAQAAGVPLGSTTYYFETLEDLHAEAIERHAANVLEMFRRRLEPAMDRGTLLDSLVDLVLDDMTVPEGRTVVTIELYALATRSPRFAAIADAWVRATQALFATHMDKKTAKGVDALLEGTVIHQALSKVRITKPELRKQLSALIA